MDAFLDHDFESLLELVSSHETLHVFIYHVARLWGACITGSISHLKVQLHAVISCWGLAFLFLSLLVLKVVMYSIWRKP